MGVARGIRGGLFALAAVVGGFLVAFRLSRLIYPTPMPFAAGRWLQDNPLRRRALDPGSVVRRIGIQPGASVLEIGPGLGLFTIPVAKALGPSGHLFAEDQQGPMVAALHGRLKAEHTGNVTVMLGDAHELDFAEGQLDLVFMVSVLGELQDRPGMFREIFRVLRPGGRLSITETITDLDYLPAAIVRRAAAKAGFVDTGVAGSAWSYTANFAKPEVRGG